MVTQPLVYLPVASIRHSPTRDSGAYGMQKKQSLNLIGVLALSMISEKASGNTREGTGVGAGANVRAARVKLLQCGSATLDLRSGDFGDATLTPCSTFVVPGNCGSQAGRGSSPGSTSFIMLQKPIGLGVARLWLQEERSVAGVHVCACEIVPLGKSAH
jgi:hypothetical protein